MAYKQLGLLSDKPWEQQPGESGKHFQLFEAYRDDPEMSLVKIAQRYSKGIAAITQTSIANKWHERRQAWTAWQGEVRVKAQEKAIADMRERHVKVAMAMQAKALKALELQDPAKMKPTDARQMLIDAAKLEMLSRGEPTEKVASETRVEGEQVVIYLPANGRD